jgi:hypothetical protein
MDISSFSASFSSNIVCLSNIYAQTLNAFRIVDEETRVNTASLVGYTFEINQLEQLELIKYTRFPDDVNISKRVAVFGRNTPSTPHEFSDYNYADFINFNLSNAVLVANSNVFLNNATLYNLEVKGSNIIIPGYSTTVYHGTWAVPLELNDIVISSRYMSYTSYTPLLIVPPEAVLSVAHNISSSHIINGDTFKPPRSGLWQFTISLWHDFVSLIGLRGPIMQLVYFIEGTTTPIDAPLPLFKAGPQNHVFTLNLTANTSYQFTLFIDGECTTRIYYFQTVLLCPT